MPFVGAGKFQYAGILIAPEYDPFVKLGVVTISFFHLSQDGLVRRKSKVVEQPSVKTTEPWVVTVGVPAGGRASHIGFHGVNPMASHSDKF